MRAAFLPNIYEFSNRLDRNQDSQSQDRKCTAKSCEISYALHTADFYDFIKKYSYSKNQHETKT